MHICSLQRQGGQEQTQRKIAPTCTLRLPPVTPPPSSCWQGRSVCMAHGLLCPISCTALHIFHWPCPALIAFYTLLPLQSHQIQYITHTLQYFQNINISSQLQENINCNAIDTFALLLFHPRRAPSQLFTLHKSPRRWCLHCYNEYPYVWRPMMHSLPSVHCTLGKLRLTRGKLVRHARLTVNNIHQITSIQ